MQYSVINISYTFIAKRSLKFYRFTVHVIGHLALFCSSSSNFTSRYKLQFNYGYLFLAVHLVSIRAYLSQNSN